MAGLEYEKTNNLVEGPVLRSLINLSLPIVFAQLLQTAYQLTDTFWVGRLGEDAIAAVSISFPIIFLMMSLGGGLSIAATVLTAQFKGKGDKGKVNYIAAQTLLMMLFLSLLISFSGYFLSEYLVNLAGVEDAVIAEAVNYLRITFVGITFQFGFFIFQALMRGVGEVKIPLYIVLSSVILNLLLDPLFIFGYGPIPGHGVTGAAFSTIGTQLIATLVGIYILINGRYQIKLLKGNFKPDIPLMLKVVKLGYPSSIEQSTRASSLTIMTLLVSSFGTTAVASYGIGIRILSFVIIPAIGMSMATSTLVGQNIGAGKLERTESITKTASLLSFVILSIIGLIFFIFARELSSFFVPEEKTVIDATTTFVRIMALTFGLIGLQQVLNGTFMGSGNTLIPMFLSIFTLYIIQLPIAYLLSKYTSFTIKGIWWAIPITNIIAAIISIYYYRTGKWKNKKLTEDITI